MKPEWGLGKVLAIEGNVASVSFKDDSLEDYRRIRTDIVELERAEIQSDPVLDNLPPFGPQGFPVSAPRIIVGDGIALFSSLFPLGFSDPAYLSHKELKTDQPGGERDYKWREHERFRDELGNGKGESMLAGGKLEAVTNTLCSISQINLLSRFERMAFKDGIRGNSDAAKSFVEALFRFIESGPEANGFRRLASSLSDLPIKEGGSPVATWPVLTLFPYLADPNRFMFLKPGPTKACADRLRFDLHYEAALNWGTYERLMILARDLLERLRLLGARDFIDVQSFMWVISEK